MRVHDDDTESDEDGFVLYNGEPFTGEVIETNKEGDVVSLVTYKMGIEHGPWVEWYSNGQKMVEGHNHQGSAVGTWKKWHKNGVISEERIHNDNHRAATYRSWDKNGKILIDERY
ncbi:hypothetical protein GCM10027570_09670 [Streptomonospora sediminis]